MSDSHVPELPAFLDRTKRADKAIKEQSKKAKPLTKGKVTKIAVGKKSPGKKVTAPAPKHADFHDKRIAKAVGVTPEPKAKASKEPRELTGKSLKIWNLINRKGGATQKELCKATGWGQVSQSPLKPICKRMGVKLHFDGRGDERVYSVK